MIDIQTHIRTQHQNIGSSELHRHVEAMENRKTQCRMGMEKATLRASRSEERRQCTETIMKEILSKRNVLKQRVENSSRRKQSHEQRGPLHLCCSTRKPLCRAEQEYKEFEINKSKHERCIKGAHEDEAAHKLETQSLARRYESRHEASDWLHSLPTVSIQHSKSEPLQYVAAKEGEEKAYEKNGERKEVNEEREDREEEQHLRMITTFHNEIAALRDSLGEEKTRDDELSKILKKEACCAKDLKPIFVNTTRELEHATTCRKSEMAALQSDWELQEQRRASLRSFVRKEGWAIHLDAMSIAARQRKYEEVMSRLAHATSDNSTRRTKSQNRLVSLTRREPALRTALAAAKARLAAQQRT